MAWSRKLLLIFVAVMLPVTVALGFWQLQRGLARSEILQDFHNRAHLPVLVARDMHQDVSSDQLHRRIVLSGRYTNSHFALHSRTHQGVVGMEIVSVFDADELPFDILVLRGWLPHEGFSVPTFATPSDTVVVQGTVSDLVGSRWNFTEEEEDLPTNNVVVANNLPKQRLVDHGGFAGWMVVLDSQDAATFTQRQVALAISPHRHFGYMFQWWALSVVLVIGGVFGYRKFAR